ncbi:hypothetical protein [Burkholderia cepacia]|uniref:hypothetical protein n=1 Tax=Burkholderia cepacia TaxID=292 RepID=UPI00075C5FB5|nr:hypothetical protein [Burkholderia cepacia]KVK98113.1 hypothetical protein WS93_21050 [Burkholderia cepacia]
MFYDTGTSNNQLAWLVQSLHDNPQHIDLNDSKDAFDIQRRIGGDLCVANEAIQARVNAILAAGAATYEGELHFPDLSAKLPPAD